MTQELRYYAARPLASVDSFRELEHSAATSRSGRCSNGASR